MRKHSELKPGQFIFPLFAICFLLTTAWGQTENMKLTNLGPQVMVARLSAAMFVRTDSGREMVYAVVSGRPARLVGYDLPSGKLSVDLTLTDIPAARFVAQSSDGWLYIAGSDGGYLSRHRPGSHHIESLGRPIASEFYLFDVVAGKGGEVFGATYPGCRIFRFHPEDGFRDMGGAMVTGEQYARNIALHRKTEKLYVGVGAHTHLIEFDLQTGSKRELLPPPYRAKAGFVKFVRILEDEHHGDKLLATVENETLIFDLPSGQLKGTMKPFNIRSAVRSADGSRLFYTTSSGLFSGDFSNPIMHRKQLARIGDALAMTWNGRNELMLITKDRKLVTYDPRNDKTSAVELEVPVQPITIRLTQFGADGRIWCTGFPMGPNVAYDPATGETETCEGLHQAESITSHGSDIYLGIYPGGKIYRHDTTRPWDIARGNPRRIADIEGQDRPFGAVSVPEHNKMVFGTVPDYGKLGGALVQYDAQSDALEVFPQVMPDLSIVSLTYADGIVVGGTSIRGGLGISPTQSEAKLFGWDPVHRRKLFELTPVEGASVITFLMPGPDGNVWGVAEGTLFLFDCNRREVVERHQLFEGYRGPRWIDTRMVLHPDGHVYATANNKLFKIDGETRAITKLMDDASWLSMDDEGRLYFARNEVEWWMYEP